MDILFNLMLLIVSIALLWKGADWVVESATVIAWTLGVSDLVIGLTVVAMGTSAPEFAVTVGAALKGYGNISVGNVVGSNIFNLGFILGGVAAIRGLETNRRLVYRDGTMLILTSICLLIFLRDLTMARWEGAVLFCGLIFYIGMLFLRGEPLEESPEALHRAKLKDVLFLLIGLASVVLGGHWLVESASFLARALGLSEWVIGVTIVAMGTSAPEFFTSLVASLKGRHGMSAGNLIGSDLFNLMGVLGLAGMMRSMQVDQAAWYSLLTLLGMMVIVVIFMRTGWRVSRREGIFLVTVNLVRWILDFTLH